MTLATYKTRPLDPERPLTVYSLASRADSLRILHAAETLKGGIATVLAALLEHQIGLLGTRSVAAIVPSSHRDELAGFADECLIPFERSGRDAHSLMALAKTIRRGLKEFRPNIVHLHSSFAGGIGRLTSLTVNCDGERKIVYSPHAFAFIARTSSFQRRLFEVVERRLAALTDRIICVSDFERAAGMNAGLDNGLLYRIYNGVKLPPEPVGRPLSKEDGPLKMLFVGRFDRQKGLDVLLKAMKMLPERRFRLTVVGEGVLDQLNPEMLPNVRYVGWVPNNALGAFYCECHVVVMPSRWEGFGLVAAEAASYGVPVVATRCCSLPEIVEDGKTGRLFDIDDHRALASILTTTPREIWHRMGLEGRRKVQAMFGVRKMQRDTFAIYNDLVRPKILETEINEEYCQKMEEQFGMG
jgi:glycosyltransferase involved in cell wall biosynthesis